MQIIITTHGNLCESLLNCYQMMIGFNKQLTAIALNEEGIANYRKRLTEQLTSFIITDDLLILCDLFGGTPYKIAYQFALQHPDEVKIVSGVNLPMLIELGITPHLTLAFAAALAEEVGRESIQTSDNVTYFG